MQITDSRDKIGPGIYPAQHRNFHLDTDGGAAGWRMETRASWLACRVVAVRTAEFGGLPGYELDPASVGDWTGMLLWRRRFPTFIPDDPLQRREMPSWRFSPFPVTPSGVLAEASPPGDFGALPSVGALVKGGGADAGGDPCLALGNGLPSFLPVAYHPAKTEKWWADRRFRREMLTLPATEDDPQFWVHPLPVRGQYGIAVDSQAEQLQYGMWLRADPRIVVPWASAEPWLPVYGGTGSPPQAHDTRTGDLACDVVAFADAESGKAGLRIARDRHARVRSFWRVVRNPSNALSGIGDYGGPPVPGLAQEIAGGNVLAWVWTHAQCGPWSGGMVLDRWPHAGPSTGTTTPPDNPLALGVFSMFEGGGFTIGAFDDIHRRGMDDDGMPINPVHVGTECPFYGSADFDGPLAFSPVIAPASSAGPYPWTVTLGFNNTAKRWEWWADLSTNSSASDPFGRRVPPCGYDRSERAYVYTILDHVFCGIMMRPAGHLMPDALDLRNAVRGMRGEDGGRDAFLREDSHLDRTSPMVVRIEAYAARSGPGWTYTHPPNGESSMRWKSGTASGGVMIMPPEVDIVSTREGFEPPGSLALSEAHVVAHPLVRWAAGLPDETTGSIRRGYRWYERDGMLVFDRPVSGAFSDAVALLPDGMVFIADTTARAPSTPSGGGKLFVDAGALKYIGSNGTVTLVAPA